MTTSSKPTFPLIAIGIPTYCNYSELEDTVNALYKQSYSKFTILVSDNTEPAKRDYLVISRLKQNDNLIYIQQTKNLGLIGNAIFLRNNLQGDFHCILHDDIVLPRDYFSAILNAFHQHPECSLVGMQGLRKYNGLYWYEYECYSSLGLSKMQRCKDLISRAYGYYFSFESNYYALYRPEAIQYHKDGTINSLILLFLRFSLHGPIYTISGPPFLEKDTTKFDIARHQAGNYFKTNKLAKRLLGKKAYTRVSLFKNILAILWSKNSPLDLFQQLNLSFFLISKQLFCYKHSIDWSPASVPNE